MTTGSGQELPITRDVLLDVRLAQAKDTHRVQVRRIRIMPGLARFVDSGSDELEGGTMATGPGQDQPVTRDVLLDARLAQGLPGE